MRAKSSGGNSFIVTNARKRAFRRAQQRALEREQTMYRGKLHSVQSLQGMRIQAVPTVEPGRSLPAAKEGYRLQPAAPECGYLEYGGLYLGRV